MKRAFYIVVAVVVVAVAVYLSFTANRGDVVRVGGKKFTEGYVMAEMISSLLESRGIAVEEKFDMGSGVVREALEHGQVDLYWEYTGTAYVMHQKGDDPAVMSDSARVYDEVKATDAEQGLIWMERAPFNNTYTLMMTREKSEELGIGSISELGTVRQLRKNGSGVDLRHPCGELTKLRRRVCDHQQSGVYHAAGQPPTPPQRHRPGDVRVDPR